MSEAIFHEPGGGRPIDLGSFAMTVKATGEDTGNLFSLLEAEEPPGFGPPLHIHHDAAEAFYVLEGEYLMFLEERQVSCPAGSFVFIPAGMRHGFRVGDRPSRKLNFFFPAAMIGYFDELSAAVRRGDAEDALAAIATGHQMEIAGPIPESYV
ncbi:MAG: cupin domain-containing protein [Gaiellaceae bacterium]